MFCKSLIDRVVNLTFEMARFRTLRYGHAHDRAWVDTQQKTVEMPSHRKFQFDVLFASKNPGSWSLDLSDEIVRNRVKEYEAMSEKLESRAATCFTENVKLGDLVAHVNARPLKKAESRPFRVVLCGSPFQASCLENFVVETFDVLESYVQDRLRNELVAIEKLERYCRDVVENEQALCFELCVKDFEILKSDKRIVSSDTFETFSPVVEINVSDLDRLAAALREDSRGHDEIARTRALECLRRVEMSCYAEQLKQFEKESSQIRWRRFVISLARETSKETSSNRALRNKSIVTRRKPYILRHEFDGLLGSDEDKNLSTSMLWNMYRTKHDEIHVETFGSDFCT